MVVGTCMVLIMTVVIMLVASVTVFASAREDAPPPEPCQHESTMPVCCWVDGHPLCVG